MASSATKRNTDERDEADSNTTPRSTPSATPSAEPEQPTGYQQNVSSTEENEKKKEKKPSRLKAAWGKLGLDLPTLLMMGKAALPPTIALSMYQATDVAQTYTTLGYLTAIVCIGAALAMLMVWTGVKARQHTTDPAVPPQAYNSSQSAVLAVWLFFQIYVVNTMKAKFPQLAFPTIIYAIFVNTSYVPDTGDKKKKEAKSKVKPEIEAVKKMTIGLQELHGKLSADLPFAKREVAFGKMSPDDLEVMFKNLRSIYLFERSAEINHWDGHEDEHDEALRRQTVNEWNEMFRLQLTKPPKKKGKNQEDAEAKGDSVKPGDAGFADHLQKQADALFSTKESTLHHWVKTKGIKLRDDYFTYQRQLFMLLYIMFLLHSISRSTLELVKFADSKDQATMKNKLIWPGGRRFKKWLKSIFQSQDANSDDETTVAGFDRNKTTVYMGEAFKKKKDPEHLPPANAWERFGDRPESSFGFRAACATMSLAIIAFLRPTQRFLRRTTLSMKTPGVLVFLWVFVAIGFYILLKRLDLVIVGLISVVTATMIVGYELQVRKIGEQAAVAGTGQPAYAIYILGPYRLATVVAGVAVAFFWTIFPYPITEHSVLRQQLGGALYLSANLFSIMHEQVMGRIRGELGGEEDSKKDSPGYQLVKARNKVFAKQMLTIQGLKMHAGFVRWEFPLGGKFPREEYEKIITHVENIVNYTALLGYTSEAFTHPSLTQQSSDPELKDTNSKAQWFHDLRRVISDAKVTSHETTSLLAMLSSSITNAQPLPPYLRAPPGAHLSRKLEMVDPEILSLKHITEPGYAAFAVMAVSTRCIDMEVERLLKAVKGLVGELDFSFHIETLVQRSSRKLD
ncbi:mfs transporter [Bipolaris maydis]|nr:mfs transporter [Bipolaris maydis]